jgi:hypothetical protein
MRVALVMGVGHSGTTIMDRILSCYPGVIGLGEVEQMWRKIERGTLREAHQCPCGATHVDCPFWSKILTKPPASADAFFRALVTTAKKQKYGMLVDISKSLIGSGHYGAMRKDGTIDEFIQLRLIRDPRGWVQSMIRRYDIAPDDANAIRGLFYRWLFSYVKLDRKTAKPGNSRLYVWYDKLVIEESQNKLAEALGLPLPEGQLISLKDANQHAIAGNKFVYSPGRERLRYDGSWLENKLVEDIYAELGPIRDYYHEVQKLHLVRDGQMMTTASIFVGQPDIAEAGKTGEFAAIAGQARLLEPAAKLPAAQPERQAA